MRLFDDVAIQVEDPFFSHALSLALRGMGSTAPNPLVGCVIVCGGAIVGEGFHPKAGGPHAEIVALADAGDKASGADVYVTLEPCAHHGKTPPCTTALIAAGVKRVFIGMHDPTAEAGGGAQLLRDAGIEVAFAADPDPFGAINVGWLKHSTTGLPYVRAKTALSLDGRLGFEPACEAWMTGPWGKVLKMALRNRADATLVGAATVMADNPSLLLLDAPSGEPAARQPLRIVLVRDRVPDPASRIFTDGAAPTLVLAASTTPGSALDALPAGVEVERYDAADGLRGALRAIGARGINDLLVEPGTTLMTALWEARALDELVTITAGGMAGSEGPELFAGIPDRTGDALTRVFAPVEAGIHGDVAVTVWRARSVSDVDA